jgi:hypothetical protein
MVDSAARGDDHLVQAARQRLRLARGARFGKELWRIVEPYFGEVKDPTERFAVIRKDIGNRLRETVVLANRTVRAGASAIMGIHADVAQLVERDLAKVEVAGSSPVVRSKSSVTTHTVKSFKRILVPSRGR